MAVRPLTSNDMYGAQNSPPDIDKLLARTAPQPVLMTVTIDSSAVDSGATVTNQLRRGLLLGKITASGKYAQFDDEASDGTEVSADAVVLAESVVLTDPEDSESTVDVIAVVVYAGCLHSDAILGDFAGLTQEDCQRLLFLAR